MFDEAGFAANAVEQVGLVPQVLQNILSRSRVGQDRSVDMVRLLNLRRVRKACGKYKHKSKASEYK